MAEEIAIAAQLRDMTQEGHQNPRAMRREGQVPGIIYGADFEALPLQFATRELSRIYRQAGTSSLVSVQVQGKAEPLPAFFRDVQRDPVTGAILHVDLYHIVAGQSIRNAVPIVPRGHAPAIELGGVVGQVVESIELEGLPRDLPPFVEADLSVLESPSSHILAGDLVLPDGVTLFSDPEMEIFQVNMPRMTIEEEEEAAAAELEEGIEYGAAEEGGEEEGEDTSDEA